MIISDVVRRSIRLISLTALLLLTPLANATVIKIATLAPDGTGWMTDMRASAEVIAKKTGNRVKLKFYPGGIMGNEESVLRKIRVGQLHGGAFTSNGLGRISPKNQIYGLPLKYRTYEEMDHVRKHMDKLILQGVKENGFEVFGLAEGGFTYLLTNKPVQRLSELKGEKIWIPQGDEIGATLLEVADLSPVALPLTDVLTGLQTSLVTTVASTPAFAIALQWHSKVKYLTQHPILYSIGAFVISNKTFSKLSNADQAVVRTELEKTFIELNKKNREDNNNALQALKKHGISFIKPDADDIKALDAIGDKTAQALLKKGNYSKDVIDQVDKLLDDFRKQKTAKK